MAIKKTKAAQALHDANIQKGSSGVVPPAPATSNKIYYKYLVNGREYVESTSSPISNPSQQGYTQISPEEFQQRLPYNQMEEQQYRKLVAEGRLPFQAVAPAVSKGASSTPFISKEDAQWYGLPENTKYFIASKNGGLASNITQAPDNTVFKFADTQGLEGYSGYFKKQGNSMVPISQQEAQQSGNIEQVNAPASSVNSIAGMGIAPLQAQSGGSILGNLANATSDQLGQFTGVPSQSGTNQAPTQSANGMISTGNPQLDKFLNETWLPLLEAEFSSDPSALANSAVFKQIKDNVEKNWGPIYAKELQLFQNEYDRNSDELGAQKSEFERRYGDGVGQQGTELERGLQDIGLNRSRTLEDQGVQQQRIARSYTQAVADTQDSMASRNLAFGGTRMKAENALLQNKQSQENELNTNTNRTLEDLTNKQNYLTSDVGFQQGIGAGRNKRSAEELLAGFDRTKQELTGERTLQEQQERERLRNLGTSVYTNPGLYGMGILPYHPNPVQSGGGGNSQQQSSLGGGLSDLPNGGRIIGMGNQYDKGGNSQQPDSWWTTGPVSAVPSPGKYYNPTTKKGSYSPPLMGGGSGSEDLIGQGPPMGGDKLPLPPLMGGGSGMKKNPQRSLPELGGMSGGKPNPNEIQPTMPIGSNNMIQKKKKWGQQSQPWF
jgi:hypothetical protein